MNMMKRHFFITDDTLIAKVDLLEQTMKTALSKIEVKKEKRSPKYLTRKEVTDMLRCSYSTVHRLINRGVLPCRKVGRKSLFLLSDVENVILTLNI